MRILVTNDDGIGSRGLEALVAELAKEHEVWTIAPDRERSGVSHGLTLASASVVAPAGKRRFSCTGTPADCVLVGLSGELLPKPEAVIAGINRGPNLGTDIVYSGTCAAAREAAIAGLPGLAVSCASREHEPDYTAAASFVSRELAILLAACVSGQFVNINAPSSSRQDLEALWCRPCTRIYHNKMMSAPGTDHERYFSILGDEPGFQPIEAGDAEVVAAGLISVSPVYSQPQAPLGFGFGGKVR